MPEQCQANQLCIKQQNCKHSKDLTLSLINMTDPNEWDILLIQEPYIYTEHTISIATSRWFPLYPPPNTKQSPRSIILISTNISSNTFEQIQLPSDVVTAITLMIPGGKINIYNIYNPPNSNEACVAIHAWLMEHPTEESDCTIWAGDFNKHDPMWTNPAHHARCERSDTETLMQLIAEHQLMLALPAGTLTYQSDSHGTWSTLDLVFCDQATHGRILTCNASIED